MTQTQELDQSPTIAATCPSCGAERPSQPHDPLCEHADTDTIVSTGETEPEDPARGTPAVLETPKEAQGSVEPKPFVGETSEAGWILKITPEHTCILPHIDDRTFVGSVWRCGECTQNWLVYKRRGKHEGTKAFKKITEAKAVELVTKHRS